MVDVKTLIEASIICGVSEICLSTNDLIIMVVAATQPIYVGNNGGNAEKALLHVQEVHN